MSIFGKNKRTNERAGGLRSFAARKEGRRDGKSGAALKTLAVLAAALALALLGAAGAGVYRLAGVYREQCRVDDLEACVTVKSGMISPDLIRSRFGLTNGVNLAEVPFAEIRAALLKNVPLIKEIAVTRRLPNRVTVEVTTREPAVRLSGDGRVADAEGVVFEYYRNTDTLALITDNDAASDAMPGNRLSGHAAAALRLIVTAASKGGENPPFRIRAVDATHADYLVLKLPAGEEIKFKWPGMDDDTAAARAAMEEQLECVGQAIATKIGSSGRKWNATIPGRVTAWIPELE